MKTKPTPEQVDAVTAMLKQMWRDTITNVNTDELAKLSQQMITDPAFAIDTQKRLLACGMICFSEGDIPLADKFRESAYMMGAFVACAEKKLEKVINRKET